MFATDFKPVREENRISLYQKEERAAYLEYEIKNNVLNIKKTVVEEKYQGKGLAKALRTSIIQKAEKEGYSLSADCSYAANYLQKYYS